MLKPVFLVAVSTIATSTVAILGGALSAQAQICAPATIKPKFAPDPMVLECVAGGTQSASSVAGTAETPTGACLGFVDNQPNHKLELKAFFNYLSIVADGQADTTIVVKGPGGTWCNDDYQGKNAGVSGQWLPGSYEVWVGDYNKDKNTQYKLKISETQ
jgi:hypothetical protein